jgi:pyruvate formate lyase activating enzyme
MIKVKTVMTLDETKKVTGRINSFESCGTVDGPGIRFVIFIQGCPLRCLYCHNPESWNYKTGVEMSAEEVMTEIKKYRNFMSVSNGGVTLSGGEPLTRPHFLEALLTLCKAEGIHTVIDTSGYAKLTPTIKRIIDLTDLFLLDVKSINSSMHEILTGEPNDRTLAFAEYLASINKPVHLRYVLVPALNDREGCLRKLAKWASELGNIKQIELLPFHKMGEFKWKEQGLHYRLSRTEPPPEEQIESVKNLFQEFDLKVV